MAHKTNLVRYNELGNELTKFVRSPIRRVFISASSIPTFMDTQDVLLMIDEELGCFNVGIQIRGDGIIVEKVTKK